MTFDLFFLGYLAVGAFVGFFAGMLGIGGGAIMIPLLVMLFERQGLPREHLLHFAVGTGMATILFTSVSSVLAHARRGAVRWDIARAITPGILAGGLVGAWIAKFFSTFGLALFFAVLVYTLAINMLFNRRPKPSRQLPGAAGMTAAGFIISFLSAMVAIGGAAMTVPFMVLCNVPILHAVATAAAIGFPIAVAGTIGYVATGWGDPSLPAATLGYVYLPALLGVSLASVALAPLGAKAAHSLPTARLKQVFAILLLVLATRMLVGLA
jgi:uncharacterized membrane protein YfcA